MSFYDEYLKYKDFDVKGYLETVTDNEVNKSLKKSKLNIYDFLNLISPTASKYIEQIAQKSRETALYNFGKTISLYAPLYISNYCSNECSYCGFNKKNKMSRKKLTFDEIRNECRTISETGIKHILFLTGEAKEIADTN